MNLLDGVTATTAELNLLDGVTATTAELNILDGVTATAAELNILDGVTATAAELNILKGSTGATSITVADADRVVLNDNGNMIQVAVTDLATYFDSSTSLNSLSDVLIESDSLYIGHDPKQQYIFSTKKYCCGSDFNSITTGDDNVCVGYGAGTAITTGAGNTIVGSYAGDVVTGNNNTIIGLNAGSEGSNSGANDLTSGADNTIIGFNAAASANNVSNEITLGNSSVTALRCGATLIASL